MSAASICFMTRNGSKSEIVVDACKPFSSVKADIIAQAQELNSSLVKNSPLFFFRPYMSSFQYCEVRGMDEPTGSLHGHVVIKVKDIAELRLFCPGVGTEANRIRVGERIYPIAAAL